MGKFTRKSLKVVLVSSIMVTSSIISSISVNAAFTNSSSTNSNYNRSEAKSYMTSYTTSPNTPTYPFFNGPDAWDCTNFVSQVVKEGGMSFTSRTSSPNYNHWYYYYNSWGWGRTATWTGAHEFRQHWGNVNGIGNERAYQMKNYTVTEALEQINSIRNDVWAGDIILHTHQSNGITYHAQVVYGYPWGDVTIANHSGLEGEAFESLKDFLEYRIDEGRGGDWVSVIQIKKGW